MDTKKLNPFRVHFMRLFNPHVGSLCSPTWGFQKHNSYRVAKMENETHITNTRLSRAQLVPSCKYGKRNTYYKYKTFKSTTRTLQIILFFKLWINTRLSRAQLVPSCKYGKRNTYYKYKTFKSTTRTELQIWKTTTHITNTRLLRVQSIPNCSPTSLLLFCHMVIMMKQ